MSHSPRAFLYLILTTPRHAEFYRAITAASPLTRIDGAMIEKACQEYGIEFVGPLPASTSF